MAKHAELWVLAALLVLMGPVRGAEAKKPPKVPREAHERITAYLRAEGAEEAKALAAAARVLGDDPEVAVAAIETLPPLTRAKRGTQHGLEFRSGGRTFSYSIRLPKRYDNKTRFPVLVLPDHGSVGPEAGISFWEQDKRVEDYVVFRPDIVKHKADRSVFPDGQFFAIDQDIALVMRDGLKHLRLHYAVDAERFRMTGLSQAGYYTWYYAMSFPDDFAVILPESAGGMALRATVSKAAPNLKHLTTRILHHPDDQITPFSDAERMHALLKAEGAEVELIAYTDKDYPGTPFPKRHPGPHHLRLKHVFDCAPDATRTVPASFTRQLRYKQQGREGRWLLTPPTSTSSPVLATCSLEKGKLVCNVEGAVYLVGPEGLKPKKPWRVGKKRVRAKFDAEVLLRHFKATGDRGRLVVAEIEVPAQ